MTTKELNRDVKRLYKKALSESTSIEMIESEIKKEFLRLYNADDKFQYFNRNSILMMFVLNRKFRFKALHSFGLFIDETRL